MIVREDLLNLNFYKKAAFTGSCGIFCYKIEKRDDGLTASIWKGPYCSDATPMEAKEFKDFEFSEDGMKQIADWLNAYVKENSKA